MYYLNNFGDFGKVSAAQQAQNRLEAQRAKLLKQQAAQAAKLAKQQMAAAAKAAKVQQKADLQAAKVYAKATLQQAKQQAQEIKKAGVEASAITGATVPVDSAGFAPTYQPAGLAPTVISPVAAPPVAAPTIGAPLPSDPNALYPNYPVPQMVPQPIYNPQTGQYAQTQQPSPMNPFGLPQQQMQPFAGPMGPAQPYPQQMPSYQQPQSFAPSGPAQFDQSGALDTSESYAQEESEVPQQSQDFQPQQEFASSEDFQMEAGLEGLAGLSDLGKSKKVKCLPYFGYATVAKYRQACNKARKTQGVKWNAKQCACLDAYGRMVPAYPLNPAQPQIYPTGGCPAGYSTDPATGQCVPIQNQGQQCPAGYMLAMTAAGPQCQPLQQCPVGYTNDPATSQCIPAGSTYQQQCQVGYTFNAQTGQCCPAPVYNPQTGQYAASYVPCVPANQYQQPQGPSALYPYGAPNLYYQQQYQQPYYGSGPQFDAYGMSPGLPQMVGGGNVQYGAPFPTYSGPQYGGSAGPQFTSEVGIEAESGGGDDIGLPADYTPYTAGVGPLPSTEGAAQEQGQQMFSELEGDSPDSMSGLGYGTRQGRNPWANFERAGYTRRNMGALYPAAQGVDLYPISGTNPLYPVGQGTDFYPDSEAVGLNAGLGALYPAAQGIDLYPISGTNPLYPAGQGTDFYPDSEAVGLNAGLGAVATPEEPSFAGLAITGIMLYGLFKVFCKSA